MTSRFRSEVIAQKLREAKRRALKPFGCEAHGFHLLEPVGERDLAGFEAEHQISVPDEYRAFIRCVGRGGAGPAYGLVPFENALTFHRDPRSANFLSRPFP